MRTSSRRGRLVLVGAIGAAALLLTPSAAQAAEVQNGSFEDGIDVGWTVDDWPQSAGTWDDVTGEIAPLSPHEILPASCGDYQAVFDQMEPATSLLYQDLVVDAAMTSTLTFTHWFHNYATYDEDEAEPEGTPLWVSPASLSPSDVSNQQYRVDIVDPDADPFSVDAGDVLLGIYASEPGDPAHMEPTEVSVDLTPFAGQTVRLRFAGVSNESYLNVGVDCVELTSVALPTTTSTVAPTTTSTAAVAAAAASPRYTG